MVLPRKLSLTFALACCIEALISPAHAASFNLYAATPDNSWTNPSTLVTVSTQSGAQQFAGTLGLTQHIHAMDFDPLTHALLGVDPFFAPGALESVNLGSGATTSLGNIHYAAGGPTVMMGLAFASDGTLYAGDRSTIGVIDRITDIYRPLFNLPSGQYLQSMDISPTGTLYAVYQSTSSPGQQLVTIDLNGMSVKSQLALGGLTLGDIDYAPDNFLYASNWSYALIRVNPTTAEQYNVGFGQIGDLSGVASVAAVPEPEIVAMLTLGLALTGFATRRRRAGSTNCNEQA